MKIPSLIISVLALSACVTSYPVDEYVKAQQVEKLKRRPAQALESQPCFQEAMEQAHGQPGETLSPAKSKRIEYDNDAENQRVNYYIAMADADGISTYGFLIHMNVKTCGLLSEPIATMPVD